MMMFIIFLLTDVSVVALFWVTYARAGKYKEGMLLGVHISAYREQEPELRELMGRYWKSTKRFYACNLIAVTAGSFLCFWRSSAFMAFWSLWLLEIITGSQYLIYRYHREIYDMKVEKGWKSGGGTRIVAVNAAVHQEQEHMTISAWFHLPAFLIMGTLLLVPGVRSYLTGEEDGIILAGICLFLSILFLVLHICMNRMGIRACSPDDRTNAYVSRLEKRTWAAIWLGCNYVNIAAFAILTNAMDKKDWLTGSDYLIFIILQMMPAAFILCGAFYVHWKRGKLLEEAGAPLLYADDDVYWKNGWYNNPSDPKILVRDWVCGSNYTINMGRPAGKMIAAVSAAAVVGLLIWMSVFLLRMDFIPARLEVKGGQVEITGAAYDITFLKSEMIKTELLEKLPDDDYRRTNGLDDGRQLMGKFKGRKAGDCRLYIYKGCTPVLHIELPDYHVFINSAEDGEVEKWYKKLE